MTSGHDVLVVRCSTAELDLKQAGDRDDARRLIGGADVAIENFRPGVML